MVRLGGTGYADRAQNTWNTGELLKEESVTEFVIAQQNKLRDLIETLTSREEGQDMVEYALLAALISIVAIAIIILLGPYLKDLFQDVVNALGTA
jgi:pilus assembly protein Flp/PilA